MFLHNNTNNTTKKELMMKKLMETQTRVELGSYVWDWHCRRRSNRWMALRRWLPVWRQATPTCHSQMSASGRWPSSWSSLNICFSISKPDLWGEWRERYDHQKKELLIWNESFEYICQVPFILYEWSKIEVPVWNLPLWPPVTVNL